MASLLIIGGSGFFGKSILDAYKRGILGEWGINEVLILSRGATRLKLDAPELMSVGVKLIDGDISTLKQLPYADFVIHAAASTDASKYILHSEKEGKNILYSTKNYCELARQFHRNSKVLYVSSGAVYGTQPASLKEISEEFSVELPLEAMSLNKIAYAIAKRDSEKMIKELGNFGLNVAVARCFAFIGKYLPMNQHFAIGNFIGNALSGDVIKIQATKKVYRSYLYADDLVIWLMSIASLASEECPIFNVGSNEEVRIDILANMVAKKLNTTATNFNCSEFDIDRYIPNIDKAYKYGMKCTYSLEQSISETILRLSEN